MVVLLETLAELAGAPSTRQRVFRRFAMDKSAIDPLSHEVFTLRVASYEGRLQQIQDSLGIGGDAHLTDSQILKGLQKDSRDVALQMLRTHNSDLRQFVNSLPKDTKQSEITRQVKAWEAARADWKAQQVAVTEGMRGRNQADRDILKRNGVRGIQKRATPRESAEAICAGIVALGWRRESDWHISLPAHPSCVHGWEYRQSFKAMLGDGDVWLGRRITRGKEE